MNRLNRTESAIFVSLICSLLPEDLQSELILSSLQLVLCRLSAVKCLPVHNHSADYVFWPFGIIVPLKPVLGGVGSVASLPYCTRTDSIKPSLLFSLL